MNCKDYIHMCIELNENKHLTTFLLSMFYTVILKKEATPDNVNMKEIEEQIKELYLTLFEEFPEDMFKELINSYNESL